MHHSARKIFAHFYGFERWGLPPPPFLPKSHRLPVPMNSSPLPNDPDATRAGTMESAEPITRRSFLGVLLGVGSVVMGAALAVPVIRFALHPLFASATKTAWSDIGKVDEFTGITAPVKKLITVEQRDGWRKIVSEKAIYILPTKAGTTPRVLSPICPHLGCSIPWNQAKQEFLCPCHGAVFAEDGTRVSGPSPRSMDELESKVVNGTLQVRYQYFRQLVATKEVLA